MQWLAWFDHSVYSSSLTDATKFRGACEACIAMRDTTSVQEDSMSSGGSNQSMTRGRIGNASDLDLLQKTFDRMK